MRTCVTSFFDSVNLGDLLIARSLQQFAAAYGPTDRLSFSGDTHHFPDPERLPTGAGAVAPAASPRARLLSTRAGHAAWRLKELRAPGHALLRATLDRADLLALGGGNMIFDVERWTRSSDRFGYFVDTARRAGTPTFGISLGIGPFASVRQHKDACRVLDRCEWLTFRDQSSLDAYLEHGHRSARLGVDPVLLMEQQRARPVRTMNRVALSLVEPRLMGDATTASRPELLRRYAGFVRRLVADGCEVELFTTDRADEAFLVELASLASVEGCTWRPVSGLSDLLALYQSADVVVAGRMHALIVAFTQGAPVVGLSWQTKVRAFFDLVDRPGQCLSLLDVDVDTLVSRVDEAKARPASYAVTDDDRAALRRLEQTNHDVMRARAMVVADPGSL